MKMKNNNFLKTFLGLKVTQKKKIDIFVCQISLSILDSYFSKICIIKYFESVCGTEQNLDLKLPIDAYNSVINNSAGNIAERYIEPISALQNMDLELPSNIKSAYYSIYNLYNKYLMNKNIDDCLIINQSLASLDNEKEVDKYIEIISERYFD